RRRTCAAASTTGRCDGGERDDPGRGLLAVGPGVSAVHHRGRRGRRRTRRRVGVSATTGIFSHRPGERAMKPNVTTRRLLPIAGTLAAILCATPVHAQLNGENLL